MGIGFFSQKTTTGQKETTSKLFQGRFRSDIRKGFFTQRVARYWEGLPRAEEALQSLEEVWMKASEDVWMWHMGTQFSGAALMVSLRDRRGHFQLYDSTNSWIHLWLSLPKESQDILTMQGAFWLQQKPITCSIPT